MSHDKISSNALTSDALSSNAQPASRTEPIVAVDESWAVQLLKEELGEQALIDQEGVIPERSNLERSDLDRINLESKHAQTVPVLEDTMLEDEHRLSAIEAQIVRQAKRRQMRLNGLGQKRRKQCFLVWYTRRLLR